MLHHKHITFLCIYILECVYLSLCVYVYMKAFSNDVLTNVAVECIYNYHHHIFQIRC